MKRIKEYIKNKKEKFGINKIFKLNYCTSILKITIALALFFIAAVFVISADVIVQNGALNVSNNLLVNTNTLFVDSANNRVGIGTTSPSNPLQVNGVINSQSASNIGEYRLGGSTAFDSTGGTLLRINQGGFTNVAIPSGNVGIGTTSPGDALEIGGGGNLRIASGYVLMRSNTRIRYYNTANDNFGEIYNPGTGGDLAFRDGAGETMRLVAGNVGIGTTSPNATLTIKIGGTTIADSWDVRSDRDLKDQIAEVNVSTFDFSTAKLYSYKLKYSEINPETNLTEQKLTKARVGLMQDEIPVECRVGDAVDTYCLLALAYVKIAQLESEVAVLKAR